MNLKGKRGILIGVLVAFHVVIIAAKLIYNKMIDEEHFFHISHGALVAQEQRRQELILNAEKTAEEFIATEVRLLHYLIELARLVKTGASAERILAMQGEIERLIASMDILVMKAPVLRSKGPYGYMMDIYREAEDSVLKARIEYNRAACEYDMFLEKFPYWIVAKLYGFKKAEFIAQRH